MRSAADESATLLDDPGQARVAAHRDGPLLVLGGPGTGKTTTLVEAVAARVAEGVDPERVLVLTFGRRIATDLRARIERRITVGGRRATTAPTVTTFHGYAFALLRRAAAEVGDPPPRLLTGPEQDLIIRELLSAPEAGADWPESLHPALRTRGFTEQLRDLLLRAAERGIDPIALAALAAEHHRPEWRGAARFMHSYQQVLALRDATARAGTGYDYAELVRAATGLLADDPTLLAAERRRVAYVYVDEFADTDPAQRDLLDQIAGDGRHLVAFADPDSSIYAFRGADPVGVADFPLRYRTVTGEPAPTVTLTRSYRSGAALLTATRQVATRLRGPARHRRLDPASGAADGTVETHTFRSAAAEANYLAHRLREAHLIEGVPWSRMAVVVRSTALRLPTLRRAFAQAGVPTVSHADDLPLAAQPAVAPLLLLLRCALEPARLDESTAVALLHSPLGGADPLAERRLRQGLRALALAAGDRRPSGVLLVEALRDPTELAAVERRWARPARAIASLLATARQTAARPGASVEDVLWAVWRASGLADRWASASARGGARGEAADRDLDAVVALFEAAARFVDRLPGARTEVFLDHVLGQQLPGDSLAPTAERGPAVRVLTAHAAKGLEWDVVAVAGVQEGLWPDLRLRGSVLGSEHLVDVAAGRESGTAGQASALLDEERRLFYVAATRARLRLLVTAVASADGAERPSRFLDELSPARRQSRDVDGVDDDPRTGPADVEERSPTRLPRALTLSALVAELRGVVADPAAAMPRREAAAAQLARLAVAGVPGAHPDEWWGLPPLSDERPLVDPGEPVTVTPSTVDSVQRCSLRWLLEKHGGANPPTPEQGVGNLVHAAAMLASDAQVDRAKLIDYVAARFDEIELSARWLAERERARAETMIDKLVRWLADNPRRLVAIERDFLVQLTNDVQIKGRVDRLEVDDQGRLVVVDIKTGKSTSVTAADIVEHPQLGAYQAAVEAGAFDDVGTESGGAALVQLGTAHTAAQEQSQPGLSESTEPGWATDLVRRTARTMAASTFEAVANAKCRSCPVRTSCPVSGKGRQVTEDDR
ncbi:MAG TPA: ATP-dependent DNA helicase [Micromonosporaceae bacterium]